MSDSTRLAETDEVPGPRLPIIVPAVHNRAKRRLRTSQSEERSFGEVLRRKQS